MEGVEKLIKACPFCGGEAELIMKTDGMHQAGPKIAKRATIVNNYVCGCGTCGIYTPYCESKIYQDEKGYVCIDRNGAIDAIDLWNKRSAEL